MEATLDIPETSLSQISTQVNQDHHTETEVVETDDVEIVSIAKLRAYHDEFLRLVELTNNGSSQIPFMNLGLDEKLMVQNVINNTCHRTQILFVGESLLGVRLSIEWAPQDSEHVRIAHTLLRAQAPTDSYGQPYIPA